MLFVALTAIWLPLLLVVVFRQPARVGMSISALAVGLLASVIWQMEPLAIGASAIQGVHRALTIGLILFGAITLLKTLESTGALERIKLGLHALSQDMRVLTVIVAFCFISLIEGISGFGTPSIIAAPLLIVLGFHPLTAAVLALLGDTVACTFGAVGTPLIIGLENVPIYSAGLVSSVGATVTLFDLIIGTLLPLGLVSVLIFMFGKQTRHQKFIALKEIAPWALFIGAVYSVSAFLAVRIIGPEFTSIVAGAISLIVAAVTAKFGFLIPKNIWRHHANPDITSETVPQDVSHIPIWKAWLPYVIVILLLLITRSIPAIKEFLSSIFDAGFTNMLGVEGISSSWPILYSPGIVLLIGALSASLLVNRSPKIIGSATKKALSTTSVALMSLVPTLIMVQIFINSGHNSSDFVAMPIYIGQALASAFGDLWLMVAPTLGAIGAFIAGSSTVSTLTMSPVQYSIAVDTGLPHISVLALQMIGAAAGNTIAIHNVVSASVVVGLVHREGLIIRKLIIPTATYLLIACLIGLVVFLII